MNNRIREVRKERGLTQEQLAKMLGISSTALAKKEKADSNCRVKTLEKIAEALDCRVTDLISEARHGTWKDREVFEGHTIDQWQSARCSNCGKYHTTPYIYHFNEYAYCPWCGAEMTGGIK